MEKNIEHRLWDYIDGQCPADEYSRIRELINTNPLWEKKYKELAEIHQLVNSSELEQPSLRFTKNVMDQIARYQIAPATKNYINKNIIWGIASFFIIIIVGFLVYGFAQINWNETSGKQYAIDFTQVDYSRIFTNNFVNAFMMLNVILGLFFLDRLLTQKRKHFKKEAR